MYGYISEISAQRVGTNIWVKSEWAYLGDKSIIDTADRIQVVCDFNGSSGSPTYPACDRKCSKLSSVKIVR